VVDPRSGRSPAARPDIEAFLRSGVTPPDPWSTDLSTLREDARRRVLEVTGEVQPVAAVEAVDVDGVPGRLYLPAAQPDVALVWAHGGGWMHGDLATCEGVARALARAAGCAVLTVDYRLAPEHPYPAGLADVWTAVGWAIDRFATVAVGGDSSGGNLAAACALMARETAVPLAAQLLVYPVLDSRPDTEHKVRYREEYAGFLGDADHGANTARRLDFIWDAYVPDPAARTSPYASPTHAPSLQGLAPVVLITAEHDILRGEALDFAHRLRNDGVPVEHTDYPGQVHGFFEMFTVTTDAAHAVSLAARGLRQAIADRATEPRSTPCSTPSPTTTKESRCNR
jgi:acetyl esterase